MRAEGLHRLTRSGSNNRTGLQIQDLVKEAQLLWLHSKLAVRPRPELDRF